MHFLQIFTVYLTSLSIIFVCVGWFNHGDREQGNKNQQNKFDSWTPLHWAAFKSQKDLVKKLISEGGDVNAADTNGCTPLFCAIVANTRNSCLETQLEYLKTILNLK
jgi:ankyrin repeat protein